MSKRMSNNSDISETKKRKRISLSISNKVEILKKLDAGTPAKLLCEQYGIGSSTIYDLKKQKTALMKFYSSSDSAKLMNDRKTLHQPRNLDLDQVLIQWIRQRRSEKVPLNRSIIIEQAKVFHERLELKTKCDYSSGWFAKFKKRHGLRILSICGDKASADHESAESYCDEFSDFISDGQYSPELVYNADETGLFWKYVSRKTYVTAEESAPSGVKDCKERLTVLACSNSAGTHKCKLLIIGKSAKPRALKNVKILPVIYRNNKHAWMTRDLFKEWLEKYFIPEAKSHRSKVGLTEDSKILLLLDNCSAHIDAENYSTEDIRVEFLPPNCTSLIQPMDQGILNSLKCFYKTAFIRKCLESCDSVNDMKDYQKQFTIRDAVWNIADSWDKVKKDTIVNAWHNIWPASIFLDGEEVANDFHGFRISQEKEIVQDLLEYAKNISSGVEIDEEIIKDSLNADKNAPTVLQLTDDEIVNGVLMKDGDADSSSEAEDADVDEPENISIDRCLELTKELISGMEQKSFFHEHDIMSVYKIQETLISEKPKYLKQKKINEMFGDKRK